MGFPTQVNVVPALAVEGDFASTNPRVSIVNQAGAFVAGALGVQVGRFAWAEPANNTKVNNFGAGAPTGFLAREQQGLITAFLGEASMRVPIGLGVVLYSEADFWVRNNGTSASAIGQKAYADNTTGLISFAASGSPFVGGGSTASTIAATTSSASSIALNSFTGSITGTVLTVSAVATGALFPGQTLSGGSGANLVNPAATVLSQLSGTKGGVGTYQLSLSQTFTSGTIAGSGGTLTVGGTVTGYFAAGQVISGSSVLAGSTILSAISGAGIAGTYAVSGAQTLSSQAINATGGLLTIGGTVTGAFAVNDLVVGAGISASTSIIAAITGTGGAGTYLVNNGQTITSQTINVNSNTETKWVALSVALPGELVKMSSYPLG